MTNMNTPQNPSFFNHHQFQDSSSSLLMDLFDFSSYPLPDFVAETTTLPEAITDDRSRSMESTTSIDNHTINEWYETKLGVKRKKSECNRVAFRTKSQLEILDDGFKWRKYGKKYVKNSPYPRNYYKCSSGGCGVKKRVEKDRDDSSYVITTYEGIHNHESPFLVYCNNDPIFHHHSSNNCPSTFHHSYSSSPYSSTTSTI